jgi:DNA-binding FadR family transcriptional regulator
MAKKTFTPLSVNRLREVVIEELEKRILGGQYKVGELLPSEKELSEQLGIGRRAVREALQTLQSKGLVETKMGVGTKVVRNDLEGYLSSLLDTISHYLSQNKAELRHILEMRGILEKYALLTLAEEELSSLVNELEQNLHTQKKAVNNGDISTYNTHHLEFHLIPVKKINNPIILLVFDQVLKLTIRDMVKASGRPGIKENSLKEHEDIIKALRDNNRERALESIEAHLKSSYVNFQPKR